MPATATIDGYLVQWIAWSGGVCCGDPPEEHELPLKHFQVPGVEALIGVCTRHKLAFCRRRISPTSPALEEDLISYAIALAESDQSAAT